MSAGLLVDPTYGYRVGNAKFKAGELGDVFGSPREMTDAVKAAIEEHYTSTIAPAATS